MALIKEKQTDFGIVFSYWKISRVSIDTIKKEVTFILNLYKDKGSIKEIEDYTFASVLVENFQEDYDKYFREDMGEKYKDIYTACYMYAKENIEFFKDAKDDEDEIELNKINH